MGRMQRNEGMETVLNIQIPVQFRWFACCFGVVSA